MQKHRWLVKKQQSQTLVQRAIDRQGRLAEALRQASYTAREHRSLLCLVRLAVPPAAIRVLPGHWSTGENAVVGF